jgi:plasmid stability protein
MANLSIRDLDQSAYEGLKKRAVKHGVSMEEEVRQIIYRSLEKAEPLSALFGRHFGRNNSIELEDILRENRTPHNPINLSK